MIKQKYNYKFFYDNYKYRYDKMFRNYYEVLNNQYRYFISIEKDINKNEIEIYRSNLNIDNIILQLENMEFQRATITDNVSKSPYATQYTYTNISGYKQIIEEYYNKDTVVAKYEYKGDMYFKRWNDSKYISSVFMDKNFIKIFHKGISFYYYFHDDSMRIHKSVPLSKGYYIKYDIECREIVSKVLERLIKDNIDDFYDDMVQSIKDKFGIR